VFEEETKSEKKIEDGILAMDPGVRTFQTGYSPSGLVVEWGKGDIMKIQRLCAYLDRLQSREKSDIARDTD